jgi:hypothetical protein
MNCDLVKSWTEVQSTRWLSRYDSLKWGLREISRLGRTNSSQIYVRAASSFITVSVNIEFSGDMMA